MEVALLIIVICKKEGIAVRSHLNIALENSFGSAYGI
jgi:hypothetical protein